MFVVGGLAGSTKETAAASFVQEQKWAQQEQQQYEQQQYQAQQAAPPPPAPAPAGEESMIDQLKQLGELKEQGILTEEEFAAQKAKLLG